MEESNRRYHVLLFVPQAEDMSVVRNALGTIGAEGLVCRNPAELGWRLAEEVDAVLLTEEGWADETFSVLTAALQPPPLWSELPLVMVAAGGAEGPRAAQAMQQLRNVLILDRPVHHTVLSSALRMALRMRDKQRQVCDLPKEREQREQALKHSEMVLAQAGQMANLGAWQMEIMNRDDLGVNPLRWSDEVYRIFGYEPGSVEVTNDVFFRHVHPEDRQPVVDAIARALAEKQPYEIEHRIVRPDGAERVVLEHAVTKFDEGGHPLRMIGAVQDITDRKRAEEALRVSEQRLRAVLENSLDVVYRRDLQKDRYDYISPIVEQVTGFTLAEVSAMSTEDVLARIHPEDVEQVRRELARATAAGRGRLEYRFRRKDGQFRWLADHFTVQRGEDGQLLSYNGVVRDITQRKHTEEQLRRMNDRLGEEVQAQTKELRDSIGQLREEATRRVLAEGRLRRRSQMLEAFFQHTISPLVFLDRYFNFVRVNEAFAKAAGKEPEYFVGKNYFALYPHGEHRAIFEQVVQAKQPYRAYAKVLTFSDAPQHSVTYWNWWLTPLLDDAGEVQSLVLNLEDVTERQKAFSQLEERARQLQQLTLELSQAEDRERKRLAEILHDDLQQLLAAAKFHLGLLSKGISGDPERRELAELVKDLLKQAIDKSRSLSHELSPPGLAHTDLQETLEWLTEQVQAKHGLAVHLDIRDRTELHSEPLKAFLYKAAQEMLFNVIKHAQVKEAQLRLRRRRGCICLFVSDRGRGFDLQATGTAGFGLRSIRERVQMLGGHMRIRSVPGRGSAFLIAVPDSGPPTEAQETPVEQTGASPMAGKKRVKHPSEHVLRVLLVDDHKIVREGIEAMLVDEPDMEIVGQAGNGREAVDLAYQLRPDVVVMDVAMPVMPGDEATRQIKLHLPETRVIALSMFDDARVAERMRRAGAIAYLLKTAPSEDLLAALRGGRKVVSGVS